ncbi:MFS transporter [Halodurantibacterium flavum]|uniref:MFS transporter n=1 Tax=Halodurantibacterium flavum TaxID=1382802 RepID=A0ABW4S1K6_9RHOB
MFERSIPEWLRHSPTPGARGFALLSGMESMVRGLLVSVYPLAMYQVFQDAGLVSRLYFIVGVVSLVAGLMVPWATRFLPRRWMYTAGIFCALAANLSGIMGGAWTALALLLSTVATVTIFVCLNAYVLDYIAKAELQRTETLRMFYSALAWTMGPVTGVWLMKLWPPAPFLASSVAALALLAVFWAMRLGNGRLIVRARAPAPNPLAYLPRFLAQPRLVAGWLFAVLRSCAWWGYIVYLPIYAVEAGLGDRIGGIALSLTNGLLFATPLMLRWMQCHSVRVAVRTGFALAGTGFLAAALAPLPWLTVACLMAASVFLILLDISGGLPFLLAVKPSERTEMSAVYSSYRDVSGILTPGIGALILLAAPVSGIFAAVGVGLWGAWAIAGRLHPQLGTAPAHRALTRRALTRPASETAVSRSADAR